MCVHVVIMCEVCRWLRRAEGWQFGQLCAGLMVLSDAVQVRVAGIQGKQVPGHNDCVSIEFACFLGTISTHRSLVQAEWLVQTVAGCRDGSCMPAICHHET